MGKSECISLVFPAATPLSHQRLRHCAPKHPHSRTYSSTSTHPRHHSRASTPTPLRTSDATLTHLRPPSIHISAPHYATSSSIYTHWRPPLRNFVLHLYTLAPPIAHLRPPFPLSELIRINQNLSELIRYPPRNFDGS